MKNFNTARSIDLAGYLPRVLENVLEFREIAKVETQVIKEIWDALEACMNDQFILEATEYGIARREGMLNITPFASDTLEDRRFRLLTRYNESRPYTRKWLDETLAMLCGADGYRIVYNTGEFNVHVKVALTAKKQENTVSELMERILPYNMMYTVTLLYNKWVMFEPYTWDGMAALTWMAAREEVLSNG